MRRPTSIPKALPPGEMERQAAELDTSLARGRRQAAWPPRQRAAWVSSNFVGRRLRQPRSGKIGGWPGTQVAQFLIRGRSFLPLETPDGPVLLEKRPNAIIFHPTHELMHTHPSGEIG